MSLRVAAAVRHGPSRTTTEKSRAFLTRLSASPTSRRANVIVISADDPHVLGLCAAVGDHRGGVVVAGVRDDSAAEQALAAGARGVVYAHEPPADIIKAVRLVERGGVWAPRHVVVAAWMRLREAPGTGVREPACAGRLSSRERDVFRYAARGLANKEVASELAISEATVKAHLTHIFQKLGLRSRNELAAAYFGIIQ